MTRKLYRARGEVGTLSLWSRSTGISVKTLWMRIDRGMEAETALTLPLLTYSQAARRNPSLRRWKFHG